VTLLLIGSSHAPLDALGAASLQHFRPFFSSLLEKFARALEVPMYQLFYDGEELPELPNLLKRKTADDILWGNSGKDAHLLFKFRRLFGHMEDGDRNMLFYVAQKMANRKPV